MGPPQSYLCLCRLIVRSFPFTLPRALIGRWILLFYAIESTNNWWSIQLSRIINKLYAIMHFFFAHHTLLIYFLFHFAGANAIFLWNFSVFFLSRISITFNSNCRRIWWFDIIESKWIRMLFLWRDKYQIIINGDLADWVWFHATQREDKRGKINQPSIEKKINKIGDVSHVNTCAFCYFER